MVQGSKHSGEARILHASIFVMVTWMKRTHGIKHTYTKFMPKD